MRARAPGKLVVSGAYVVLDGAPAVVAAVDRYAIADTERRQKHVGDELLAAFGDASAAPAVDTVALRSHGRKLGLGSSAAAVVAALLADLAREGDFSGDVLLDEVARRAFEAHRRAQGGGSGIDVIACAYGGVRVCEARHSGSLPAHRAVTFAPGLVVEAWVCPTSASTSGLLAAVRAFRLASPGACDALLGRAAKGAARVVDAFETSDLDGALRGFDEQRRAIGALGDAAGAPILPRYMRELGDEAEGHDAVFAQAGAGGGDMALYFGRVSSPPAFRRAAAARSLRPLALRLGVAGATALAVPPRNLQ